MRWTIRLLVTALVLVLGGPALPALGEELPPGFTDGRPVGGPPEGRRAETTAAAEAEASSTERYFGAGAFTAVRDAVAATSRPCAITNDGLTALVLAPVFSESSAATTASSAPSPM